MEYSKQKLNRRRIKLDFERSLALSMLIPFLPPKIQKLLTDNVLRDCEIKLTGEDLKEYEEYYQRVEEKFQKTYMEKV